MPLTVQSALILDFPVGQQQHPVPAFSKKSHQTQIPRGAGHTWHDALHDKEGSRE